MLQACEQQETSCHISVGTFEVKRPQKRTWNYHIPFQVFNKVEVAKEESREEEQIYIHGGERELKT